MKSTKYGTAAGLGFALPIVLFLLVPMASAGNIITFDDNANSCGGAVMCSTNGTTGYLIDGTGKAFDLSTINSWFQIDVDGTNHLATQTVPEPDKGAGGFLVTNNTGKTVTSWSLTLTDTFNASTPGNQACDGTFCQQFQANQGAGAPSGTETLSGPDIFSCSTATLVGTTCNSSGANATALFKPNSVTYTWNGLDIAPNATFDITFASWPTANNAFPTVPEPPTFVLVWTGVLGLVALNWRRKRLA